MPSDVDIEVFKLIIRDMHNWDTSPSIKEMRADPKMASNLRPESIMNPILGQMLRLLKSEKIIGCMAPSEPPCGGNPVSSHSIQLQGSLARLADSTNHVGMFRMQPTFNERPKLELAAIGIRQATTFPGLCNKHDTEIFAPLERNPLNIENQEQNFLLSYRSVMRECYAKSTQSDMMEKLAKYLMKLDGTDDMVNTFCTVQAYAAYVGDFHMKKTKAFYDFLYKEGIFRSSSFGNTISCIKRSIPIRFAFAVASFFTPFFDFNGQSIEVDYLKGPLPFMALDVHPLEHSTAVCASFATDFYEPLKGIIDGLNEANDQIFTQRIWELAIMNCENMVISLDAWKELSQNDKSTVEKVFGKSFGLNWAPSMGIPMPKFN